MICPNCQTLCGDTDRYCYLCGTPLQAPPNKPKKGSRWVPVLILLIMSAAGLAAFFTSSAHTSRSAAEPWFRVSNGVLYFDKALYTGGSELTVPGEINGETVYDLAPGCFRDCTELTSITLPDSLSGIGNMAFDGCTGLRGISIPESVVQIGSSAFLDCTSLEAISIPRSVSGIGERAFTGCSNLHFIFFGGSYAQWTALYDGFINPYTSAICSDGSFFQGGNPYE